MIESTIARIFLLKRNGKSDDSTGERYMAGLIILYWRDIPAQVIARRSRREQVKHVLPARFLEAIDKAAMRSRAHESDSYLKEWRKSTAETCGEDLTQEAARGAKIVEGDYDDARLSQLVANGGLAKKDDCAKDSKDASKDA